MGLVEEEDELGLLGIADFRKFLEKFRHHPEQESSVERRRCQELVGGENVNHAVTVAVGLDQIVQIKGGFAQEFVSTLLLQTQQPALDRADTGGGDVAVLSLVVAGLIANMLQHGLQVFQIKQKKLMVVSNFESQGQHARLCVVEIE